MGRRFAPAGDRIQEHLMDAMMDAQMAWWDLDLIRQRAEAAGVPGLARQLDGILANLASCKRHVTAAEAIRAQVSPRRQARLSRLARES